ncbi:hypothetical protein OJF2_32300 [Aquisphaera giovannonii]|uniref:Mycothiol-dependent maleylpyruvate isomerase metal-binding domain-containing protein n=1 Tax=Aquisphaera giovannonii TaxID=406548 RepID=A0A5B9W364_9BACT|nr:maleylpyruvate isomerase N-terminal domain-containing protein [Aquisphaera giovannonii]QEH34689.1 hypothetical protein OJF2_32300 [Aquisphaera giovannonii]
MRSPEPILVAHLFRELDGHLLDLLRSLSADDWQRPTVCSAWSVKDIASHLLDTALRRLSMQRDGYAPPDSPREFHSHEELVAYLHRLNAQWTSATSRLSPRVLIAWTQQAAGELAELFESADPFAPALFPVAWAGELDSRMWFDAAREFTERWHHQRQIADALDRPTPIDERRLQHPVLDTFLRALPHTYRDVNAPEGTIVCIRILGDAGGEWFVRREGSTWKLYHDVRDRTDSVVTIDQSIAWKFLTKRTDRAKALARFPDIRIEGEPAFGEPALEMVSIMA